MALFGPPRRRRTSSSTQLSCWERHRRAQPGFGRDPRRDELGLAALPDFFVMSSCTPSPRPCSPECCRWHPRSTKSSSRPAYTLSPARLFQATVRLSRWLALRVANTRKKPLTAVAAELKVTSGPLTGGARPGCVGSLAVRPEGLRSYRTTPGLIDGIDRAAHR